MTIEQYKVLIRSFVERTISAPEFKDAYVDIFLAEPGGMKPDLFWILEDLFEDAEAFTQHWLPPLGLADVLINADGLREEARTALDALDGIDET